MIDRNVLEDDRLTCVCVCVCVCVCLLNYYKNINVMFK